ncbi:YihY/virulence factor BrkB family protein [bacterium]|nr:YihY/virulence factor BrkB family protein [bacterium]
MKAVKNFITGVLGGYKEHDCFHLAAYISFYAILALIPLTMIAVSAAGLILESSEVLFQRIVDTITTGLPHGISSGFITNLQNVKKGSSSMGWLGFGTMIVISTFLFSSLEYSLDKVFKSVRKRNFFHSKLVAIILIFSITLFFSLPTIVSLFERIFASYGHHVPLGSYITARVFFFLFAFFSFLMTIFIVPNHRVKFINACIGALTFAVIIVFGKYIFNWYLEYSFDRYNIVYGSLTALVLILTWIYSVAAIMLLSAEIVAYLQKRKSDE